MTPRYIEFLPVFEFDLQSFQGSALERTVFGAPPRVSHALATPDAGVSGALRTQAEPRVDRQNRTELPVVSTIARIRRVAIGAILCVLLSSCMVYAIVLDGTEITVNPVLIKVIEEVAVPAIQEGPILNIQVREGQVVELGQTLMQLDDQRARLKQQQAELEQKIAAKKAGNRSSILFAETETRVANSSLQRAMDSRKRFPDTPSQAEVDEIELRVAQAKQHFEQATQEFQLAELAKDLTVKNFELATFEVERHQIKSPIQGAIIEIIAKKGEWVRPGEPLVRVMRVDRLKVEGFLKRESVSPSLLDRSVSIVVEGGEGEKIRHPGKIVFISPVVEPNDRTQRIVAEVDNSKGLLGPGLRAKMMIHAR